MTYPNADQIDEVDVIRTGLFVDRLIGIGGIPKKRITEVCGDEGVGKSTLCLQICAEAQAIEERCLWVDAEGTFTSLYARKLGVDTSKLAVLQMENGEDLLNEVLSAVKTEAFDLIVIDSIGGLTPRSEHEKAVGEVVMAGQSRLVSSFMRKLSPILPHKNVAVVVINHTKQEFETGRIVPAGGKSLRYYKAISIRLKKKSDHLIMVGDKIMGYVVVGEVWTKNKLFGNVGMKLDAQFMNNEGFSKSADILEEAIQREIFTKEGNTYYLDGEKVGMKNKLRELIKDDPVFAEKIKARL